MSVFGERESHPVAQPAGMNIDDAFFDVRVL